MIICGIIHSCVAQEQSAGEILGGWTSERRHARRQLYASASGSTSDPFCAWGSVREAMPPRTRHYRKKQVSYDGRLPSPPDLSYGGRIRGDKHGAMTGIDDGDKREKLSYHSSAKNLWR